MSTAAYQRQWRAKRGARTGARGPRFKYPCTYKRHRQAGEEPCAECRARETERQRKLYRARKARDRGGRTAEQLEALMNPGTAVDSGQTRN